MRLNRFHYEIFGESSLPKCVFLHGVLGQGKNWRSFARHFSGHFQCLVFDQRGHGQSFHGPPGEYGLSNFSQDLLEILEDLGWSSHPVHLLGHSMGGRVAVQFANAHPQSVEKLVVVDIGPTSDWQSMGNTLKMIAEVPVPFGERESAKSYLRGPFAEKHGTMMAEFFLTNICRLDGVGGVEQWGWRFHQEGVERVLEAARQKDHWDLFRELQVPTLLIRGERSTYLSAEAFEQVVRNNPNIQGAVVPEAGHWVHAEQPVATLKILKEFFMIAGAPS